MIILGIDPGSNRTGWGVIRRAGPRLELIDAGTIDAERHGELPARLLFIYDELRAVITKHAPTTMAVEDIFHARFAGSALKLGHARGVALLAGANAGLPISAYAPTLVKRSVAGRGHADKLQVARIVGAMLGMRDLPEVDATDALAIAITHANAQLARGFQEALGAAKARKPRKRVT